MNADKRKCKGRRDANKDFFPISIERMVVKPQRARRNTEVSVGFHCLCALSGLYFFFNIFPNGRGGNNPHPAPVFQHESVEGRRRGCLLHCESSSTKWPPSLFPNPVQKKGGRGLHSILLDIQPAARFCYISY